MINLIFKKIYFQIKNFVKIPVSSSTVPVQCTGKIYLVYTGIVLKYHQNAFEIIFNFLTKLDLHVRSVMHSATMYDIVCSPLIHKKRLVRDTQ